MSFADYTRKNEEILDRDENRLDEKLILTWRIRSGKRTKKWKTTRKNYRVQIDKKTGQPKEVYITELERINRRRGQRKAALKRRAKQKNISRLRKKAFMVRRNQGMRYDTGLIKKKIGRGSGLKVNYSLIHPNMMHESADYRLPVQEILPGYVWDVHSMNESGWIMQLESLFRTKTMSVISEGDEPGETVTLTDGELSFIAEGLEKDLLFRKKAREDFASLSGDEKISLVESIPRSLADAII